MNIKINYGSSVFALPGAVTDAAARATAEDLRVLLALCADPSVQTTEEIASKLNLSPDTIAASVAFWRGTGILSVALKEESIPQKADAPVEPAQHSSQPATASEPDETVKTEVEIRRPHSSSTPPRYTSEELADLLESRAEAKGFIDECSRLWGNMLNPHEVNVLLTLVDYLGLEWDYVLTLLAYCVSVQEKSGQRKSMHYVEKKAYEFYDRGATDLHSLQEQLLASQALAEAEGQLRTMFGMGDRIMTPKEKKCFSAWLYDFQFSIDMIRAAYEITVDAKGNPNMNYMNSILSNWNRDGIRTLADVERDQQAHRAEVEKEKAQKHNSRTKASKDAPPTQPQGSFDTNDFFSAAVRRSLGDDFLNSERAQGDT